MVKEDACLFKLSARYSSPNLRRTIASVDVDEVLLDFAVSKTTNGVVTVVVVVAAATVIVVVKVMVLVACGNVVLILSKSDFIRNELLTWLR